MSPPIKWRAFFLTSMCGRYSLVSNLEVIEKRFQVHAPFGSFLNPNISIADAAPVITSQNPRELQLYQFGLQPSWAQKSMVLINARSEGDHNPGNQTHYQGAMGIIQKPAFRKPIRSQRCLVIADAFIEGPTLERLNKPYLIYPTKPAAPFAMAGIWEEWKDLKTQQPIRGFSIITGPPLPTVAQIGHHRSPIVLTQAQEQLWLDENAHLADITSLLKGNADFAWNAYPITKNIKAAKEKSVELLIPVGDPIHPHYSYQFSQRLMLHGMGTSPARTRRNDENNQLSLF